MKKSICTYLLLLCMPTLAWGADRTDDVKSGSSNGSDIQNTYLYPKSIEPKKALVCGTDKWPNDSMVYVIKGHHLGKASPAPQGKCYQCNRGKWTYRDCDSGTSCKIQTSIVKLQEHKGDPWYIIMSTDVSGLKNSGYTDVMCKFTIEGMDGFYCEPKYQGTFLDGNKVYTCDRGKITKENKEFPACYTLAETKTLTQDAPQNFIRNGPYKSGVLYVNPKLSLLKDGTIFKYSADKNDICWWTGTTINDSRYPIFKNGEITDVTLDEKLAKCEFAKAKYKERTKYNNKTKRCECLDFGKVFNNKSGRCITEQPKHNGCKLIFNDGSAYQDIYQAKTIINDDNTWNAVYQDMNDKTPYSNEKNSATKKLTDLRSIYYNNVTVTFDDAIQGAKEIYFKCNDNGDYIRIKSCMYGWTPEGEVLSTNGSTVYTKCVKDIVIEQPEQPKQPEQPEQPEQPQEKPAKPEISPVFGQLDNMLAQQYFKESSHWINDQGKFNVARLASDSIAGVVLGTVSGVVTSHIVKKSQVKNGFEDLKCVINGQNVAEYNDVFTVTAY